MDGSLGERELDVMATLWRDGPGTAPVADGTAARGGLYCPDGVYPDSIDIDNQTELDRLSGCERLDGSLVLRIFPGIDGAPLSSLRSFLRARLPRPRLRCLDRSR